jgi:hypothetical protein
MSWTKRPRACFATLKQAKSTPPLTALQRFDHAAPGATLRLCEARTEGFAIRVGFREEGEATLTGGLTDGSAVAAILASAGVRP